VFVQVAAAQRLLAAYQRRYAARLRPADVVSLRTLCALLDRLARLLRAAQGDAAGASAAAASARAWRGVVWLWAAC
jgi:hypothetical protein